MSAEEAQPGRVQDSEHFLKKDWFVNPVTRQHDGKLNKNFLTPEHPDYYLKPGSPFYEAGKAFEIKFTGALFVLKNQQGVLLISAWGG